jgi:hypothetical protein
MRPDIARTFGIIGVISPDLSCPYYGIAIRGWSSMSVVRGPSISLLPAACGKTSPVVGDFDRDINQLDGSPHAS